MQDIEYVASDCEKYNEQSSSKSSNVFTSNMTEVKDNKDIEIHDLALGKMACTSNK